MALEFPIRGRQKEVGLLLQAWKEICEEQTRLVVVSGDPGTGKTRLVQELYHRLRDEAGGVEYWPENFGYKNPPSHLSIKEMNSDTVPPEMPYFWLGLKCNSPFEGKPGNLEAFINARGQIWRDFVQPVLLRNRKGNTPWAKIWNVGAKAVGVAAVFFPEPTLVMLATGASAYTSALKLAEQHEVDKTNQIQQAGEQLAQQPDLGKLLKNLLREANQTEAESRGIARVPWIIAIDDIQWLDMKSRELLRDLLTEAAEQGYKLLVIATARSNMPEGELPGIKIQLDNIRKDDKLYSDIELSDHQAGENSLTEAAAREILIDYICIKEFDQPDHNLVRIVEPPNDTVNNLLRRAGRNPQYIIHYARYVWDKEWMNPETCELTAKEDQLREIPGEIEALIDERLKLLGEGSLKHTAMIGGAMQGETFCAGYIEHLVKDNHGIDDVAQALDELNSQHNLLEEVEDVKPPERFCKYRHTLTFERAKKLLEDRVGFKTLCKNALGETLKGKLIDESLNSWPGAEQFSALHFAFEFSHVRVSQASETDKEGWRLAGFYAGGRLIQAYHRVGNNIEAEPIAQLLWQEVESNISFLKAYPDFATSCLFQLAVIFMVRGNNEVALEVLQIALEVTKASSDDVGAGRALGNMGGIHLTKGNLDTALLLYQQSFNAQTRLGDELGQGQSLNNLGIVHRILGKKKKARECFEQSLEIKKRLKDEKGFAQTLNNLGSLHLVKKEYEIAKDLYEQSLKIKRKIGDKYGEAQTLGNLGSLQLLQGNGKEAQTYLVTSLDLYQQTGYEHGAAKSLAGIAKSQYMQGEVELALKNARQALGMFRKVGDKLSLAESLEQVAVYEYDLMRGNLSWWQERKKG